MHNSRETNQPALASCVVLYHTTGKKHVLNLLETCTAQLIVVDNTPESQTLPLSGKTHLIRNHNAGGLARALNRAARLAMDTGHDWILMMDQDSEFTSSATFQAFTDNLSSLPEDVALIAPQAYSPLEGHPLEKPQAAPFPVTRPMTSGSILRLSAWQKTGGFREELFIDSLDNEMCLHLQQLGYRLLMYPGIPLRHALGNMQLHRTFFSAKKTRFVSHHPPIRHYYIMRNRLWVMFHYRKEFPHFFREEGKHLVIHILKTLLYERQRLRKLLMLGLGTWDFLRNRLGPLRH